MEITRILTPNSVYVPSRINSKKRLFQDIAQAAADRFGLEENAVHTALLERESLGPTGVGRGVAIPHARIAEVDQVRGLFFLLEAGIDFESVERKPVDLVFVLLAPQESGADHLKALARVSRQLRSENICSKIRSTTDPQAVYAILTEEVDSQAA